MPDFKDLGNLKFNKEIFNKVQPVDTMSGAVNRIKRQQEDTLRILQESKIAEEKEKLRRHNELVSAINNAAENGATIVIDFGARHPFNSKCSFISGAKLPSKLKYSLSMALWRGYLRCYFVYAGRLIFGAIRCQAPI
ncbi:hypothetical protein [Sporosarcina sp. UB5]|uniref:hypothetical protein n=1 Tax=Sporosarcina sp. UB5 TaxID=3047463 RepID=UPI003D79826C